MIEERKVTLKLDINVYYDGKFDQEELRQKLLETLKKDHWDCVLEVAEVKPEHPYEG